MPISVENASIEHLNRLCEIEAKCFKSEAFTKRQIADMLIDRDSISLIAKEDGEIIGFVIGTVYVDDGSLIGHVLTVDVLPEHRRKGVGLRLLHEIEGAFSERGVKVCRLEVRQDNVAALNLYRKLGYKEVETLKGYYKNADGVRLEKVLVGR